MDELFQYKEILSEVKEIARDQATLREKVIKDVYEAMSLTKELYQKQAVLVAKIEVRGDSQESDIRKILQLLQGDGESRGLVGRTDRLEQALEQALKTFEDHHKAMAGPLSAVATYEARLHTLEIKQPACEVSQKDVQDLKTNRDKLWGGWQVLGIIFASLGTLFAVILQLYQAFGK